MYCQRETVHVGESGPKLVGNVSEKGEQQYVKAPIVDFIAPVQVGMHSFGNKRAIQDVLYKISTKSRHQNLKLRRRFGMKQKIYNQPQFLNTAFQDFIFNPEKPNY